MKFITGKLIVILVMGCLAFSYAEVWGEDWKFILKNKVGDDVYYDADSLIRPSKGIVRVTVKVVYIEKNANREAEKLGSAYKDLSHRIILLEMNCMEKKEAFLEITAYSKKGKTISSIKPDKATWIATPPESIGEGLNKILCR
jgi:hypothetical protein